MQDEKNPTPNSNTPREYKKVGFKEFFDIAKWTFLFNFNLDRQTTTIFLILDLAKEFQYLINTYLISRILDTVVTTAQSDNASIYELVPLMSVIAVITLVLTVVSYFRRMAVMRIDTLNPTQIDKDMYSKAHGLGIKTLENPKVNDALQRSKENMNNILRFFFQFASAISSFISTIVYLVLLVSVSPLLVFIVATTFIPKFLIDKKYRSKSWEFSFNETENRRRANSIFGSLTSPQALQEIIINNTYNYFHKKYSEYYDFVNTTRLGIYKSWFTKWYFFDGVSALVLFAGYLIIFNKYIQGEISVGEIYFNITILNTTSRHIESFFYTFNQMMEYALRLKDIRSFFETENEVPNGATIMPKLKIGPEIKIKDLSFKYPRASKFVLKNLNLDIKSGEKIAIVGENGAGKTTLVKLISRIYIADEGQLLINGTDIKEIEASSLFKNLGVLFQDFNTYPYLNAKENILLGNPIGNLEDFSLVKKAARNADALKMIESFDNKFDQVLSEKYTGGIRPSTGQWQKIAIARFFYRNAPLVIFDEPTAAIDAVSEFNIFNKIYEFFENKTVLIISHRFSTVRNADRIIVLDEGRIKEQGTHKELMALEGIYANAFSLQASGYRDEVESIAQ